MALLESFGEFFTSFNVLDTGNVIIFMVIGVVFAKIISKTNEEWMLGTIMIYAFGLFTILANEPAKYILLITIILIIILGWVNRTWTSTAN